MLILNLGAQAANPVALLFSEIKKPPDADQATAARVAENAIHFPRRSRSVQAILCEQCTQLPIGCQDGL